MKKYVAFLLIGVAVLSLCACGGGSKPAQNQEVVDVPTEEVTEKEAAQELTTVKPGQSLETDSFKMVVESIDVLDEYVYSLGENVTSRLFVEEGYKLLAVRGTMENTGLVAISDSAFAKEAVINGNYVVDGFDVRLTFERNKSFELDPYTEQRFVLYVNIPEKLAEQFESVEFKLGYNSDFSIPTTIFDSDGTRSSDAENWFVITQ